MRVSAPARMRLHQRVRSPAPKQPDNSTLVSTTARTSPALGTAINVRHLAATPVGRLVSGEAEVTGVDGRQIEFTVSATEGPKAIGSGSHSRVVVDVAKFVRRLE
jgi:hypothetical protein